MFSAEFVIVAMTTGMLVGAVCATVALRVLVIDRQQRAIRDAHRRTRRALALTDRALDLSRTVHKGTPYRPETVEKARRQNEALRLTAVEAMEAFVGKPGLRLVDGEAMYSSQWLNDDTRVNP